MWVTCHLSHLLGLSFKQKRSTQALTSTLGGCSLGLGTLLCSLRHFPSCNSARSFRHLKQTPPGSSQRLRVPNKFSITAFCSSHLLVTLTPPLPPPFTFPHRRVHHHASPVSTGRGRCRFAGKIQRRWERPAHQIRTDNHITCSPHSQVPSVTLVQIHAAPWGCINVRERKMRF